MRADRYVGDELALDGLGEEPVELLAVLGVGELVSRLGLGEVPIPVLDRAQLGVARTQRGMGAGGEHPHAVEERPVREQVLEREVLQQVLWRDTGAKGRVLDERLDLRTEQQVVAGARPVQRLDPVSIAGDEERALVAIPDGEGEHAVEALDAARAPLAVGEQHDLGVGVRAKRVAARDQLVAQLAEVVEFAVVDDRQAPVLGTHRLVTGGRDVDHRQAPAGEADGTVDVRAVVVGATMDDRLAHELQDALVGEAVRAREDRGNAAHRRVSSVRRRRAARRRRARSRSR
jgi:hypothetical protein